MSRTRARGVVAAFATVAAISLLAAALSDRITIGAAVLVILAATAIQLALSTGDDDRSELGDRAAVSAQGSGMATDRDSDPRPTGEDTAPVAEQAQGAGEDVGQDPPVVEQAQGAGGDVGQDSETRQEAAVGATPGEAEKLQATPTPEARPDAMSSSIDLARYRRPAAAARRPQCPRCGRTAVERTVATDFRCTRCTHEWVVPGQTWPLTIANPSLSQTSNELMSKEHQQ